MTEATTRDEHNSNNNNSNNDKMEDLENMTDVDVLQKMLEGSEDLEFRRLLRAQLRKLKKGNQESDKGQVIISSSSNNSNSNSRSNTSYNNYVGRSVARDQLLPTSKNSNNSISTENGSAKAEPKSGASIPRKNPTSAQISSKSSLPDAEGSAGQRLSETIDKLKSTADQQLQKSTTTTAAASGRSGCPPFEMTLKPVTPSKKAEVAGGSGIGGDASLLLRNRGNPTARQALKYFKQMDNEAFTRSIGSADPQEALMMMTKRASRNINPSPNNIKEQTLNWCKNRLWGYENVSVDDFSASWSDGLAFCALASSFFPDAFDFDALTPHDRRNNFRLAFDTLEKEGGIVPLLEVEDMVGTRQPDWKCVFTYVNSVIARMAEVRKEKQQQQQQQQ